MSDGVPTVVLGGAGVCDRDLEVPLGPKAGLGLGVVGICKLKISLEQINSSHAQMQ